MVLNKFAMDIRNYFKNKPAPLSCDFEEDEDTTTAMHEPSTSGVSVSVVSDVQIENSRSTSTKVSCLNAMYPKNSTL